MIKNENQYLITLEAIKKFKDELRMPGLAAVENVHPLLIKAQRDATISMIDSLEKEAQQWKDEDRFGGIDRPAYGDGKIISKEVQDFADQYAAAHCAPQIRDMVSRSSLVFAVKKAIYAAADRFKEVPGTINETLHGPGKLSDDLILRHDLSLAYEKITDHERRIAFIEKQSIFFLTEQETKKDHGIRTDQNASGNSLGGPAKVK